MVSTAPRIAAVIGADSQYIQTLFATTVADWRATGVKVVGVIAETHNLADRSCGAGFLRDIATGKPFSIYLETAPSNTSCHLDADGVNAASASLLLQVQTGDLVVLSKFGKLEAMRSGLTGAFEAAIAAGKPLLTTVSEKHRDAWRAFAPDATFLPADKTALQAWWRDHGVSSHAAA
jgi:nucleoside-triphosphatase THEP1